jgi:hypothetical protein
MIMIDVHPRVAMAILRHSQIAPTMGSVLFWGDIWGQANSLSGGPAPAQFKGSPPRRPSRPAARAG